MIDQHRARPKHPWAANPEDWQRLYDNAGHGMEDSSCILELRARVEALEKAQRKAAMDELRAASAECQPATTKSLVEQVADTLCNEFSDETPFVDLARAAIREVAACLRSEYPRREGCGTAWANLIEEEANQ